MTAAGGAVCEPRRREDAQHAEPDETHVADEPVLRGLASERRTDQQRDQGRADHQGGLVVPTEDGDGLASEVAGSEIDDHVTDGDDRRWCALDQP